MSAVETCYAVQGWGVGELWTRGRIVLAHSFAFDGDPERSQTAASSCPPARARAVGVEGATAHPRTGGTTSPATTLAAFDERMGGVSVPKACQPVAEGALEATELVERVAAFLGGSDVEFQDVVLDLVGCTPFQLALADALRAVPRGEVVTYGELAALAGRPGAQRAAGTFCATNRFAFVIPCHRVVAADGIGGYGDGGVTIKRRLLALEGVCL
ncbi:MAG: methylated-DNA--[protein]-cysteine S-methyltransferase [Gaiellaceae bacterium]